MAVPAVNGLQGALKLYASDKVKDRADGHTRIRGIFSDRDNLRVFQETARRDGGAGWIALFQCLFQVVVLEKKAYLKKAAGAQAEKRLADAISLVRWMTERSVHLLSRKPFMSLFTHMVHLLIYASRIFRPASLDYAKALRCLLNYPPHLANLEEAGWKTLMSICWAAVLNDPVTLDDEWDETSKLGQDELDEDEEEPKPSGAKVISSTVELVTLIPILLSSPAAPLLPPLPSDNGTGYHHQASLGYSITDKCHRFLSLRRTNESVDLNILRSLNIVLEQLELNCRQDFVTAGANLYPALATLWESGSRPVREQVLISLRFLLNFCGSPGDDSSGIWIDQEAFGPALEKINEFLVREAASRWGLNPLDVNSIRFRLEQSDDLQPFETRVLCAGLGFSHDQAMSWVALELYADTCVQLHNRTGASAAVNDDTSIARKRQKRANPLDALIRGCGMGPTRSRLLHLQVVVFLIDRHWSQMVSSIQEHIHEACLALLDDAEDSIQDWAFIALASLASLTSSTSTDNTWSRAWTHCIRKAFGSQGRSASHLASSILSKRLLPTSTMIDDLESLLRNVDIQGPLAPFDSSCTLIQLAMIEIRSDVRLYSAGLESRVMSWVGKWTLTDLSTKMRLKQHGPADLLRVLAQACSLQYYSLPSMTTIDNLPDCAVVNRLLAEHSTQPIRQYGLKGRIPSIRSSYVEATPHLSLDGEAKSLDGLARNASATLKQHVDTVLAEWTNSGRSSNGLRDSSPTLPADRIRRGIDVIILAASFQLTLSLNGIQTDSTMDSLAEAINKLSALLVSRVYDAPAMSLMWSALKAVLPVSEISDSAWPVLLKPNSNSGVRQDMLPKWDNAHIVKTPTLQRAIWISPKLADALKSILSSTLDILSTDSQAATTENGANTSRDEDDDFGEIRTADADAMPLSKEALDCRRIKSSLTEMLVCLRVKGLALSSASSSIRDSQLINTFLGIEGERFVTLGLAICRQIKSESLRVTLSAVDLMLEGLEEMTTSYAYAQDEGMLQLVPEFLEVTTPVWINDQNGAVAERAILLAKAFIGRNTQNQLPSWKSRLALILLVDEYLDYDPEMEAWNRSLTTQDMNIDDTSPTDVIAGSLVDRDMRVRFRGTTSAAGLLYLTSIPISQHTPFYLETVNSLPREPKHWDSFLTDLLWKLNCCIASSQLRAAAIYHLYEIPSSTEIFNSHLELGLSHAAQRLGLSGIAPLFVAHAPLIVSSQISADQNPLRVPPKLCGFMSRHAYAMALLDSSIGMISFAVIGEKMANGRASNVLGVYNAVCEAAGMSSEDATTRYLPSIVARAIADHHNGVSGSPEKSVKALQHLPGLGSANMASVIKPIAEDVIGRILELLDCAPRQIMAEHLAQMDESAAQIFASIIPEDAAISGNSLPPASSIQEVVEGITFARQHFRMSDSRAVFNGLHRLYRGIHEAFLVPEQYRRILAIGLILSLNEGELRNPAILGYFLQETTYLLSIPDLAQISLAMLAWGFGRLSSVVQAPETLGLVFNRLGTVYGDLGHDAAMAAVRLRLRTWVLECSTMWKHSDMTRIVFDQAQNVWPAELKQSLVYVQPSFESLVQQVSATPPANLSSLYEPVSAALQREAGPALASHLNAFKHEAFWTLKNGLKNGVDDNLQFLDILHATHGEIHPPTLESRRNTKESNSQPLNKSTKEEPTLLLRAAIIEKVAALVSDEDQTMRFAATDALRSLVPHLDDLKRGTHLDQNILKLLTLMTPNVIVPLASSSNGIHALEDTQQWIQKTLSPSNWISSLAHTIAQIIQVHSDFYLALVPLMEEKPSVGSSLLPHLVHATLLDPYVQSNPLVKHRDIISAFFTAHLEQPGMSDEILQIIVDIVLHLRHHRPPSASSRATDLSSETWLDLDYILLSEAAIKCRAYATAIMFLELLRSGKLIDKPINLYDPRIQKVMYETYSNVEDPDGFYAIKTHDVGQALHRRLIHEGDYWRSFGLHSAEVQARSTSASAVLAATKDLHRLGLDRISGLVLGNLRGRTDTEDAHALTFDLAWRTGDWDLPIPVTPSPHTLIYSALRAVHRERDLDVARKVVKEAIMTETARLPGLGPQRITQVQRLVKDLLCLREIHVWLSPAVQAALDGSTESSQALQPLQDLDPGFAFATTERLVSVRRSLIASARERESQYVVGDLTTPKLDTLVGLEKGCLLHLSRLAREHGDIQAANNAITAIRHIEDGIWSDQVEDEFGQVLWAQHEHALSIQHMEQRLEMLRGSSGLQLAMLSGRLAKWTSIAKYRTPEEIQRMFNDARLLADVHKMSANEQSQICHDFATFADSHQQALSRAPELEQLSLYIGRKGAELQSSASATVTSKKSNRSAASKSHAQERIEREIKEDEEAMQQLMDARDLYVKTALQMYARSLALSDQHDDLTTRMISLWLEHDTDEPINKSFSDHLRRVPSHKFIFLGPQLAARLDRPKVMDVFNTLLSGLMLRLCREHPFHILYQIITLAEGVKPVPKNRRISDGGGEGRAPAAAAILSELANGDATLKKRTQQMKAFADGAIIWCLSRSKDEENASVSTNLATPNLPMAISSQCVIPPATAPPPVDPTCKYNDIAPMVRFRGRYQVLGGIHRPKKMYLYDARSVIHKQLYKGEDEVRQDAVMEQVFEMSNILLSRDRKARDRGLRFRTYVVIPLAKSTGIMEFVGDSMGIGDWLKPAHHKYGQATKDIPSDNFRQTLRPLQEVEKNWSKLPAKFVEMRQRFHPVMRYFFTEHHRDPLAWFTMRLNYTRSAAVTSIVGWMLGIGDRHCSNILIDGISGELVHIDFGIVFEDGQRLRIPEKVPFRLTNDIVDGFGIAGVDGTFRRCSEHTLRVLRGSSELIMTVLEVFKHDPLYAWDADPDKLQRAQGGGRVNISFSASALERADRILSKIRQKLRDDLSIEYRVNELIQEARNTDNLAKIFIGWQPWF